MSLDFLPATFPSLSSVGQKVADAQSRASGHAAGYAAGLRAAGAELAGQRATLDAEHRAALLHDAARMERALSVLATAAAALESRTVPVVTDAQHAIAASALELAEAILGSELADGPASAQSAVRRALNSVDPSTIRAIRLNPLDLAVLDTTVEAGVAFVADATVARGDAIADLAVGYLDARIATAVARARTALTGDAS